MKWSEVGNTEDTEEGTEGTESPCKRAQRSKT